MSSVLSRASVSTVRQPNGLSPPMPEHSQNALPASIKLGEIEMQIP